MSRPNSRPVAVIAALEQEAHVLVNRMPRAEGVIPGLGRSISAADRAVAEKLLRAAGFESKDARSGLVVTGDQLVTSRSVREALLRDFPDAACIDMETAAVGQVAHLNGLPWS